MIVGIGVDLCPVDRIKDILQRHGDLFADRVFTSGELKYAGNGVVRSDRLAARFAAKEAAIKALGAPEGLRWHDLEVVSQSDGRPELHLVGEAEVHARGIGMTRSWLSLSHAGGMAVAMVILEGEG